MGIRILIIEDDEEIAEFVVRGLREEGYTIEHAPGAEDGWHALRLWRVESRPPRLVAPRHGPPGALRRYRQAQGEAPVLFLTAKDAISDRVRGLDGGADDYLCKPFDFEELLA